MSSKDNANPVIHFVSSSSSKRDRKELDAFQQWGSSSSAVLKALSSFDKPLGLLTNAGLQQQQQSGSTTYTTQPSYIPCTSRQQQQQQQHITTTNQQQEEEEKRESYTENEIFDMIRNIQDPEHPLTLEQLNVVNQDHVSVKDNDNGVSTVHVRFTPTIPHCSMATLIGLSLRVKLGRSLPPRFLISVRIEPGTHASEHAINKQLADKERVTAALENAHLLGVVNKCIINGMTGEMEV